MALDAGSTIFSTRQPGSGLKNAVVVAPLAVVQSDRVSRAVMAIVTSTWPLARARVTELNTSGPWPSNSASPLPTLGGMNVIGGWVNGTIFDSQTGVAGWVTAMLEMSLPFQRSRSRWLVGPNATPFAPRFSVMW